MSACTCLGAISRPYIAQIVSNDSSVRTCGGEKIEPARSRGDIEEDEGGNMPFHLFGVPPGY